MSKWAPGEAVITRLISEGRLQEIIGAQADGLPWLNKAKKTLGTAEAIIKDDPESGYVLAYDAARHACTALLIQQGLRPTTVGGHSAVEQAVRAQFGDGFRAFGTLRRRRNELEYPSFPGDLADTAEASQAVGSSRSLVTAAEQLLPHLQFFR